MPQQLVGEDDHFGPVAGALAQLAEPLAVCTQFGLDLGKRHRSNRMQQFVG